jgi:hypothetical protein
VLGREREVEADGAHGLQRRPVGVGRLALVVRPLRVVMHIAVGPPLVEARQPLLAQVHREPVDHVERARVQGVGAEPVEGRRVQHDGPGVAAADRARAGHADLDRQTDVRARRLLPRHVEHRRAPLRGRPDVQVPPALLASGGPAAPLVFGHPAVGRPTVAPLDLVDRAGETELRGRGAGIGLFPDRHLAELAEPGGAAVLGLPPIVDAHHDRDDRVAQRGLRVRLEPPGRINRCLGPSVNAGDVRGRSGAGRSAPVFPCGRAGNPGGAT